MYGKNFTHITLVLLFALLSLTGFASAQESTDPVDVPEFTLEDFKALGNNPFPESAGEDDLFAMIQPEEFTPESLTDEEMAIPSVAYQEFSDMDRTSQVPFQQPVEKPESLSYLEYKIMWPEPRFVVDNEGYTWFSAQEESDVTFHIYRVSPDGEVDWSLPVVLPYNTFQLVFLSNSWPVNWSWPVLVLNDAVVFLTYSYSMNVEAGRQYAFEAFDKTGKLRWRTPWVADGYSENAWRVSGNRMVTYDYRSKQLIFYSLRDGSITETVESSRFSYNFGDSGGPHEMSDGTWISYITETDNGKIVLVRHTLPDFEIIWELPNDPDNRFTPPVMDPVLFIGDSRVIVGTRNALVCLDAATGERIWENGFAKGNFLKGITPQGNIVVAGYDEDNNSYLMLFSSDGTLLWNIEPEHNGFFLNRIYVYDDGSILFYGGLLVLVNPDGFPIWEMTREEMGFAWADEYGYSLYEFIPAPDGRIMCGLAPFMPTSDGYYFCLGPPVQE